MKILSSKLFWLTVIIIIAFLSVSNPLTAPSDGELEAKRGILACFGNHRGDANEPNTLRHDTRWIFQNFDSQNSISITRIQIFDAVGDALFDSDAYGKLPVPSNPVDPANIGPHQTLLYVSTQLAQGDIPELNTFGPENKRPLQFIVHWSGQPSAISLDGKFVFQAMFQDYDGNTKPFGRHEGDCRMIYLK